jgi:hypothetical protein
MCWANWRIIKSYACSDVPDAAVTGRLTTQVVAVIGKTAKSKGLTTQKSAKEYIVSGGAK